jgi:hypothetical protein
MEEAGSFEMLVTLYHTLEGSNVQSLSYSQEPVTGTYPEPDESSPCPKTRLL